MGLAPSVLLASVTPPGEFTVSLSCQCIRPGKLPCAERQFSRRQARPPVTTSTGAAGEDPALSTSSTAMPGAGLCLTSRWVRGG